MPFTLASWLIAALVLFLVVNLKLLPALIAGLLVYHLVNLIACRVEITKLAGKRARMFAVILVSGIVITLLVAVILAISTFLRGESGGVAGFLARLADILETSRASFPEWIASALPRDAEGLKNMLAGLLRDHSAELQLFGKDAGRSSAHVLLGMVIGAMLSLREVLPETRHTPFVAALLERARILSVAFGDIVFAQIKIAALNTFFTWLYLGVALPLAGIHLPFAGTLVVVTFVAGLLPILGNLISNSAIVIVSFGHSPSLAVASLMFLVVTHKLEYFLNAKIVGGQISAKAWELLIAMLAMEAAFGLHGLVAAPIYYAYLKSELRGSGLI